MKKTLKLLWIIFPSLALFAFAQPGTETERVYEVSPLQPAGGSHLASTVDIHRLGRYEISAHSKLGVGLRLNERMRGPGEEASAEGAESARISVLLDKGQFQAGLRLPEGMKPEGMKEPPELSVQPFKELNNPPPRLVEFRLVEGSLGAREQLSYWIEIEQRQKVILEAAGRHLEDLRLWKNGGWVVNDQAALSVIEPVAQKPLGYVGLELDLAPGFYLLTAYGGDGMKWGREDGGKPFYLRMGIPTLPEAGDHARVASPFGLDRFRIPRKANFYRLALPEAEAAEIWIKSEDGSGSLDQGGSQADISKKSKEPVASVFTGADEPEGYYIVTVKREAGKPYALQHFRSQTNYSFSKDGRYWIATVTGWDPEDEPDSTIIMSAEGRVLQYAANYHANSTLKLDQTQYYQRRFNILNTVSLFFEVKEHGRYRTAVDHGQAAFKFEPFLIDRPKGYRAPDFRDSGAVWELNAGFYELTIRPKRDGKGAGRVSVVAEGDTAADRPNSPVLGANRIITKLNSLNNYVVYSNHQAHRSGLILRSLPIALEEALPVTLAPGESLDVEATAPGDGVIDAVASDGRLLEIEINGKRQSPPAVGKGPVRVGLKNPGDKAMTLSLGFTPKVLRRESPLPAFDVERLNKLPPLPVLSMSKPLFLDLAKNATETFQVNVTEPGLYRLETSGLLHTAGQIRTRTSLRLNQDDILGVARNFLIQEYLVPGEYQLQVTAQGETAGRIGLHLQKTVMHDEGLLPLGVAARQSLKAGEGLVYQFESENPGKYAIQTFSLGLPWRMRLEDAGGWPLLRPGGEANLTQELQNGRYRLMLLPQAVDARAVAKIDAVEDAIVYEGHGPHAISLNKKIEHVWKEPQGGAQRETDRWRFVWPANAEASVQIESDMLGQIKRMDGTAVTEEFRKMWKGMLDAGEYELVMQSRRPNNLLGYSFVIESGQLMVGQSRSVTVPGQIDIAVGESQLVELHSLGNVDVAARLLDGEGRLLANNDDAENDWNFHIAKTLQPGRYSLQISSAGDGQTEIGLSTPRQKIESPVQVPAAFRVQDDQLHLYPLQMEAGYGLLLISAKSLDNTALRLEQQEGNQWRSVGAVSGKTPLLAIPLAGSPAYRLAVWSTERRRNPIEVTAAGFLLPSQMESGTQSYSMQTMSHAGKTYGALHVRLVRPGVFTLADTGELPVMAVNRTALQALQRPVFNVAGKDVWLLREQSGDMALKRVRIIPGKTLQVWVPAGEQAQVDMTAGDKPVLIMAQTRVGMAGLAPADVKEPGRGMDHQFGVSVSLIEPSAKSRAILLWNAQAGSSEEIVVDVTAHPLASTVQQAVQMGSQAIPLPANTRVMMDGGVSRPALSVQLPEETAMVWHQAKRMQGVLWAGAQARSVQVEDNFDRLEFWHVGGGKTQAQIDVLSQADASALNENTLYKRYFPTQGQLSLPVSVNEGLKFMLMLGPVKHWQILGSDGLVYTDQSPLHGQARLLLEHGPGALTAWLQGNSAPGWQPTDTRQIVLPAVLAVSSNVAEMSLNINKPSLLHFRADAPLLMRWQANDSPAEIQLYEHGALIHRFAPAGSMRIQIQSPHASPLQCHVDVDSTEAHEIKEGLGAHYRIEPGGAELFRFELEKDTKVGLGVRADKDLLQGRLRNAKGDELGRGVVQMHALKAGVYYFAVESAPDNPSVQFQPALVGTAQPGMGPPDEVIKHYVQSTAQP